MRKLLISVAVLAAISAGLSGCGSSDAKPVAADESADRAIAVETTQARRGELVRVFSGTAALAAERAANLVSETGGEVLKIYVEEGDRVAAGQVLARIDGARAQLALAQTASVAKRLDHEAERANLLLDQHMIAADAVDRARFERDAQRASVDLAALSLSKAEIRAPYAGVITRRHIKTGQWLGANALAFEIADFSDLVADVPVPEKELAGLDAGQPVTVHADAFRGQAFAGKVERIGAIVDGASGTANVRIDVEEADTALRPGQFVRIAIERERIADALLVPKSAIVIDGRKAEVFTVAAGKAQRQPVTLGSEQDGWVQLLGGVVEGTEVVTLGQSSLSDGDEVVIVNSAAANLVADNTNTRSAP
ncbi:MAG: efflux RND transporter periplasmic adaptor subunit [Xanthomonadales bacterium]|nr:efflux RND transporter periplasmic adaptor subunit [Xanthomonadales bacterium]